MAIRKRVKPDPALVEALLREREGYLRYDRKDRIADVDAALKAIGAPIPPASTK